MPLKGEKATEPTYEILGDLPGGKGWIVLANHKIFGRKCVQKVVDLHGTTGELAFQEPRLLDRASHSRITPIGEVQFDPQRDKAVTFIMPFYEGLSVALALETGHRFSLHAALAIIRDALDALAYLHTTLGYIHRDVKPGNILMPAERDRGYLSDFGSAAKIEADGRVPARLGTVLYLPPEARTTGRLGVTGDVYGAGLALFELLNGPIDYTAISPIEREVRLRAGKRAIPDRYLELWEPQAPASLRRIVRKAMHQHVRTRYPSARDFLVALGRVRVIDWLRTQGARLAGEWIGSWPPDERIERRRAFRVTSQALKAGAARGSLRVEAFYRRAGTVGWRRFVSSATIGPNDARGLSQFFEAVAARAAHRRAAR